MTRRKGFNGSVLIDGRMYYRIVTKVSSGNIIFNSDGISTVDTGESYTTAWYDAEQKLLRTYNGK